MGALLASTAGICGDAWAGDGDFRLNHRGPDGDGVLFSCGPEGCLPRNDRFRSFVGQLGQVFAPRLAAPAATLGHAGFHASVAYTASFVAADDPAWGVTEQAQRTGEASPVLSGLHGDFRKGLPFGFELAAQLQWLVDSQLFAPGAEIRWALEKTHRLAPDFAARAAVSHLVGNRDLRLTVAAFEGVVSKDFGAFGMAQLTPWAGWAVVLPTGRSRIIDPTPGTIVAGADGVGRRDVENDLVFEAVDFGSMVHHRVTLGLRTLVYVVLVSVQAELRVLGEGDPVHGLSARFGLEF